MREIARYQDSAINYLPDRQFANTAIYVRRPAEVTGPLRGGWCGAAPVTLRRVPIDRRRHRSGQ